MSFSQFVDIPTFPVVKSSWIVIILWSLGGDPTGTGKGGQSIFGKEFDDEIHEELKHTGEWNIYINACENDQP